MDDPWEGGPLIATEGAETAIDGTGISGVAIIGIGRLLLSASVGGGRLSFVRAWCGTGRTCSFDARDADLRPLPPITSDAGRSLCTEIVGTGRGLSLRAMVGIGLEALPTGFRDDGGPQLTEMEGMFGLLMVGTIGSVAAWTRGAGGGLTFSLSREGNCIELPVDDGGCSRNKGVGFTTLSIGVVLARSTGFGRALTGEISCLSSTAFGCQPGRKLTIGLPGLSETIVGVGSFALRSFNEALVAFLISSLRISLPSFMGTTSSGIDCFDSPLPLFIV